MRSWQRIGVPVVAAAVLLVALAYPGAAQTRRRTTTTIEPAPGEPAGLPAGTVVNSWALSPFGSLDPRQPGDRPFFSYEAAAGAELKDSAILFNYSNVPLTFRVYPTDAFNNANGGFDLLRGDKAPKEVGAWITLPQETLTLPAKTQASFEFTVRIPQNANPGDHAGAILASSPTQGTGPDGKVLNLDRRTGSRVYIRVAGPLAPELAITEVKTTYRPSLNPFSGKNDVSYRVENQGNVRLAGKHRVSVSAPFGLFGQSTKYIDLPELLPGQGVTLQESFRGSPASFLNFATAKVDPGDVEGKTLGVESRRAATMAIPWTIVAVVLIAYLVRYARRAYRRHLDERDGVKGRPQPA